MSSSKNESWKGLISVSGDLEKKEKIKTLVFEEPNNADFYIASQIAKQIKESKKVVLGLATGATPVGVYSELVRMHKEEGLSFKNVVTFNLDEYYPIKKEELQSYHRFMSEHLFDHIDIPKANIHIPDGEIPESEVEKHCENYEQEITKHGGIDIQILGIGRTGHIGFNEPGSDMKSKTRILYLDRKTRRDAASDFFSTSAVPKRAITMGVGTIFAAKKIFLLAYAEHKAKIIKRAVEGSIDSEVAASYLQTHPNTEVIVDLAAANELTRRRAPWTLIAHSDKANTINYDQKMTRKAVIWLALKLNKPILKLTEDDYIDGHLQALLNQLGKPAHRINVDIFNHIKNTITGWPGGRPSNEFLKSSQNLKNVQDSTKSTALGGTTQRMMTEYIFSDYEHINQGKPLCESSIYPKKVLIFSPHPDDDVISMGGTLLRLVEQGHNVSVVYQTSGDIAVWDDEVLRFSNFAKQYAEMFGLESEKLEEIEKRVEKQIASKKPGEVDTKEVLRIKGLIRAAEARSAARYCGVKPENIHFLNLPFYETGKVKKNPLGEIDISLVKDVLEKVKPHQIYAAGDLSDPHGTHRQCLLAIMKALELVKNDDWFKKCEVWLYRGAWQEWEPQDIEMCIPMSPNELLQKRYAIFKHQSQKDTAPFPGSDPREFWQRSEARNRSTAKLLDQLGLPEYEACEAFVRMDIY